MQDRASPPKGLAVPSGRFSRLARLGGLAGGVAGAMLVDGARQWADGRRPTLGGLLMTPANARRITEQLSNLRGAAMKMGQLMSMDGGDLLPPELADIMGRLRADAQPMPPSQLFAVLGREWGKDWRKRFETFEIQPIAAASIGQVHRARTRDGRDMAIKVQYPGVRESIDSDVDNVASLIRLAGLAPHALDIAPLLVEAKRQLQEEADYEREAGHLSRFGALLHDASEFAVPSLHADFATRNVLAMSYLAGGPVESLTSAPQAERDRAMTRLIGLLLRELFEFRLMQTDANFANYRHDPATGRLVLLDFGAVRTLSPTLVDNYRALLRAGLAGDQAAARAAMMEIGFFDGRASARHQASVVDMFETAMAPLRQPGLVDFGALGVAAELRDHGLTIAADRDVWRIPPIDTLFVQRKLGGVYLLGARLKARVDVRGILERYV